MYKYKGSSGAIDQVGAMEIVSAGHEGLESTKMKNPVDMEQVIQKAVENTNKRRNSSKRKKRAKEKKPRRMKSSVDEMEVDLDETSVSNISSHSCTEDDSNRVLCNRTIKKIKMDLNASVDQIPDEKFFVRKVKGMRNTSDKKAEGFLFLCNSPAGNDRFKDKLKFGIEN
jgi:hypothetical protein